MKIYKFIFIFSILFSANSLYASQTNGTIDATNHSALLCTDYACSTTTQINFLPTNGDLVHITDQVVTGDVWSERMGWINLNPGASGVINNSDGMLAGYAWGENTGWINFKPTHGGVTIGTDGKFSGWAWAQNAGWIKFDCNVSNACVQTDWRPHGARTVGASSGFPAPSSSGSTASGFPVLTPVNIPNEPLITIPPILSTIPKIPVIPINKPKPATPISNSQPKIIPKEVIKVTEEPKKEIEKPEPAIKADVTPVPETPQKKNIIVRGVANTWKAVKKVFLGTGNFFRSIFFGR